MRVCLMRGMGLAAVATLAAASAWGQGGDTIASATVIGSLPHSSTGTTAGYANDYDEVCPYTGSTAPDVVYAYTPGSDGLMDVSLCGNSAYDTKVYVYENGVGTQVGCNDDACSTPSFPSAYVSELLGVSITAGNTYYIVIDGYGTGSGNYTLDVVAAMPPTGACCVNQVCQATTTLPDCDNLGGIWYVGESCPGFVCPVAEACGPGSMYSQIPTDPNGGWTAGTSDANTTSGSYVRYENYSVPSEIGEMWFWGLTLFYPWAACVEEPMDFEIVFWPDDGTGMPDLANPACTYNPALTGVPTTYLWSGFMVYRFQTYLDPCCGLLDGWVSVQGTSLQVPTDCWFLWCSSGETGAGQSWFWDAVSMISDNFDLSMCLYPCSGPAPTYLDGPYDPFQPLYDPTAMPWHELWPQFCNVWDCIGWVDNGDGFLSECDLMEFADGTTWHVEWIGPTVIVEVIEGGPVEDWIYMDYQEPWPGNPIGPWHEIHPAFCTQWFCIDWMDNGNGILDFCDWMIFDTPTGQLFLHVVEVATDIIITEVVAPPCPEDINQDGVVDVLDLLALLAAWGSPGGPADVNGDGIVDVLDLLQLLAAWGPC